jgi:hypothetical protein
MKTDSSGSRFFSGKGDEFDGKIEDFVGSGLYAKNVEIWRMVDI